MTMGNFQRFTVRCLLYFTDYRWYDLFEIRFFMQFGISCIAFPKLESLIFFPWHNQNVEWSIIALLHFLFSRHFVHFYHVTIRTLAGFNLCRKDFVQPRTSKIAIQNWQQGEASSNTWSTVLEIEKETKQEIFDSVATLQKSRFRIFSWEPAQWILMSQAWVLTRM